MIVLYVIVEGRTEEGYARDVLAPHLVPFNVYAIPSLVGSAGHKGGFRRYQKLRVQLSKWMHGDSRPDLRFTTMIDLYRIPTDFPGFADCGSGNYKDPHERVTQLERHFGEDIGDERFIPYVQLHEFEAMLLAEPSRFQTYFPNRGNAIEQLERIAQSKASPELIDDGAETSPSKQIISVLPDYRAAKPVAGPQIAQRIGLDTIRKKCTHFGAWLACLESLDKANKCQVDE